MFAFQVLPIWTVNVLGHVWLCMNACKTQDSCNLSWDSVEKPAVVFAFPSSVFRGSCIAIVSKFLWPGIRKISTVSCLKEKRKSIHLLPFNALM